MLSKEIINKSVISRPYWLNPHGSLGFDIKPNQTKTKNQLNVLAYWIVY